MPSRLVDKLYVIALTAIANLGYYFHLVFFIEENDGVQRKKTFEVLWVMRHDPDRCSDSPRRNLDRVSCVAVFGFIPFED